MPISTPGGTLGCRWVRVLGEVRFGCKTVVIFGCSVNKYLYMHDYSDHTSSPEDANYDTHRGTLGSTGVGVLGEVRLECKTVVIF